MKNYEIYEKCCDFLNKICVLQNYCNKYVESDVSIEDLKENSCGHWGNAPAINFLTVHLIDLFKKHNIKSNIVIGTGHAGSSYCANLWLSGNWYKHKNKYPITKDGLNYLINDFGKTIRTEINPQYPTSIYDGGELGYSLAFAYGYAHKSSTKFLPCIIGDGECETSATMSSFQLNRILDEKKVLPIINLNSYKMSSKSYLSKLTDSELINLFSSFGYSVIICKEDHEELSNALENAYENLQNSPLIIFKNKKGAPAINNQYVTIENSLQSHKNPLSAIKNNNLKTNILSEWIKSYGDIFFKNNKVCDDIIDFMSYDFFNQSNKSDVVYDYKTDESKSLIENLDSFLSNKDIAILSPDEIVSNRFFKTANSPQLIELLSENVLQGFMQGIVQSNNNCLYITYESFSSIFISMVSQYQKYLKQSEMFHRLDRKSLNYFFTSTAFENNYSHQNPEFVASLLNKEYKNINIYYPASNQQLKNNIIGSLSSHDCINVITCSKSITFNEPFSMTNDCEILVNCNNPDLVLCATGDYNLKQILSINELLLKILPELKIKVVYISNLSVLSIQHKNSLSKEVFDKVFDSNCPTIYTYMGYKSVIRNLLYQRNRYFTLFGYEDGSAVTGCVENKFRYNQMGKLHVILKTLELLQSNGNIPKKSLTSAKKGILDLLGKYYDKL